MGLGPKPRASAIQKDLGATFHAEKLNMAIGIWGVVIGASTAGGPILGGPHLTSTACVRQPRRPGPAGLSPIRVICPEHPCPLRRPQVRVRSSDQ